MTIAEKNPQAWQQLIQLLAEHITNDMLEDDLLNNNLTPLEQ